MKLTKEQERTVREVVRLLDRTVAKNGLVLTRRAVNRWTSVKGRQVSLERRKAVIERELAEVSRRLRSR